MLTFPLSLLSVKLYHKPQFHNFHLNYTSVFPFHPSEDHCFLLRS